MFENVFNLSTIIAIAGLVALAGGAAGYFKASRGNSIIQLQGAEIDSLRRSAADSEKVVAKLTESCNQKDQTIEELRKHVSYLQKLGQGSPQLKKLTAAIENQTKVIETLIKGGDHATRRSK